MESRRKENGGKRISLVANSCCNPRQPFLFDEFKMIWFDHLFRHSTHQPS